MNRIVVFVGALLTAAPLLAQTPAEVTEMKWLLIAETKEQILERLGQPRMIGEFGEFVSMQFQIGVTDLHDFSHLLVFRKSDGAFVSLTRNYEPELIVDEVFPEKDVIVHHFPDAKAPLLSLRLRRLPGGRVLMAMGSPKHGKPTGQLLLMRESELVHFYPWLKDQLAASRAVAEPRQ